MKPEQTPAGVRYRIVATAEEHVAGFHAALDRVARERRFLAYDRAPPLADTDAFVRALRRRGFPQFVALTGTRVIGWCDIAPFDRPVFRHAGVLGLGVVPEFRRRGIGRALLETALRAARRIGLIRVELSVREPNRAAITLYEKVGFTVEGIKRDAVRTDDGYEDLVLMALRLDR